MTRTLEAVNAETLSNMSDREVMSVEWRCAGIVLGMGTRHPEHDDALRARALADAELERRGIHEKYT